MVLARNTYRFGLLVIAFGIAEGVRTMGGYGADVAGIGFLVGALGLFGGTLAHLARGPEGPLTPPPSAIGSRTLLPRSLTAAVAGAKPVL